MAAAMPAPGRRLLQIRESLEGSRAHMVEWKTGREIENSLDEEIFWNHGGWSLAYDAVNIMFWYTHELDRAFVHEYGHDEVMISAVLTRLAREEQKRSTQFAPVRNLEADERQARSDGLRDRTHREAAERQARYAARYRRRENALRGNGGAADGYA